MNIFYIDLNKYLLYLSTIKHLIKYLINSYLEDSELIFSKLLQTRSSPD